MIIDYLEKIVMEPQVFELDLFESEEDKKYLFDM